MNLSTNAASEYARMLSELQQGAYASAAKRYAIWLAVSARQDLTVSGITGANDTELVLATQQKAGSEIRPGERQRLTDLAAALEGASELFRVLSQANGQDAGYAALVAMNLGMAAFRAGLERNGVFDLAAQAESMTRHLKERAKLAADTRHDQPGGSREKRDSIRAIWASGKYSNRDLCAEEEYAALGISFSAARKHLRGTPDPS